MTKKDAQDWIAEIDDALEYRRQFGREDAWNQLELDYLNDPNGHTAIGPNLIHSMGDSLMSSLQEPDPEFIVTPERQIGLAKAPIIESLDNYLLRKLRLKKYVNAALLNGYLFSTCILKIGYDSEFSFSPYYDIGQGNNLLGMSFTQFNKKGHRIESPDIQPGWPWVRPVLPHDIVVPWGTLFLEDAPWIAHRVIRHIDSIKADKKYRNTSRLQPEITMEEFMQTYSSVGSRRFRSRPNRRTSIAAPTQSPEFLELWEIRDRMTGTIKVVTRTSEDFLRDENDAIQLACGMPFVTMSLVQSPRSFWSTPIAYYLGQLQATEFDIALQSEKQRRINVLKFLYRKNAISAAALNKILSGDVGAAAEVDTTYPLNEILQPVNTGTNYDATIYSERNRSDAREAVGFSRNQLGDYDRSSRRTATEANRVAAGAAARTNRQSTLVTDFYLDAIEKIDNLIFEFWRVPREIMSGSKWIYTTGPELKGDYQYSAALSFKRQISRAERKVEAFQMLLPLLGYLGKDPVAVRAIFEALSEAAGDVAFERILMPMSSSGGSGAIGPGGAGDSAGGSSNTNQPALPGPTGGNQ